MTRHNAVVAPPLSRNSPVTAFNTSLTHAILHACGSPQMHRQRQRERVSRAISGDPNSGLMNNHQRIVPPRKNSDF